MKLYIKYLIYFYFVNTIGHPLFYAQDSYRQQSAIIKKSEELVFNNCELDKTHTMLVIGNWSGYKHDSILKSEFKYIYLLGLDKTDNLNKYKNIIKLYRLIYDDTLPVALPTNKVILAEFDLDSVEIALLKLKNSIWWNINGLFLVMNTQTKNSCELAYFYLKTIWRFNILSAIFLCHSIPFGIKMYTFNPFTAIASKFWNQIDTYKQENGQSFVLFTNLNNSTGEAQNCKDIWFDKTQDISNFEVKIIALNYTNEVFVDNLEVFKIDAFKYDRQFLELIWGKIKANISYVFILESEIGQVEDNGTVNGITADIFQGKYEMTAIEDFERGLWKNEFNTYVKTGLCFVTRRERISVIEQLSMVFPWSIRSTLFLFSILISVIFCYLNKTTFSLALLDVYRLILGFPTFYKPIDSMYRLIILWFIFLFMAITAYLQSQLSAMLSTVSTKEIEINTNYDLRDKGYTVYTRPYLVQYFYTNYLVDNLSECLKLVRTNNTIACMDDCTFVKYNMPKNNELRVSKHEMYSRYNIINQRDDSPFRNKILTLYYRLYQHGIISRLLDFDKLQYRKPLRSGYKNISVYQLRYALYVLMFSYVVGFFLLFIEILVKCILHFVYLVYYLFLQKLTLLHYK